MTADNRATIARPEDILGFIPHALGLWPKESLVAMTLRGHTLGATLRVDLPPDRSDDVLAVFSRKVREYLEVDKDADGVLLAVFSDDGWDDGAVVRRNLPILTDLDLVLARGGLALRGAWIVGANYWRSAFCTDEECCPAPGRPLDQILDSRLNAEMVYRGSSVSESPNKLGPGDEPTVDPEFMRSEDAILEEMLRLWRSKKAFEDLLDAWMQVFDSGIGVHIDGEAAAFLRASLRVPAWRDAVVVLTAAGKSLARGGAEAFRIFNGDNKGKEGLAIPPGLRTSSPGVGKSRGSAKAGEPRRPPSTDIDVLRYGDVLLGLYPENPAWDRLVVLDHVMAMLARYGGGEARAAALTIRGWIQWCQGSGSFANEFLSQADAEHQGYRLAELLAEVVRRGTVCGWASKQSSAWRKFDWPAA